MRILALRNNLQTDIKPELDKAAAFMNRRSGRTFTFDIKDTQAEYKDFLHLAQANAKGYDAVIVYFDRLNTNPSDTKPFTYALMNGWVGYTTFPAGLPDATAPDYIWNMTAHELVHFCIKRCLAKGKFVSDPMDLLFVNEKWQPYYKNYQPDEPDSNFSVAFNRLEPYWDIIDPMNNVTITRITDDGKETIGTLTAQNNGATFTCKTLELPWKDNKNDISCIPKGTYQVLYKFWPKKLKYTYEVQNVPNRSGIKIHSGNYFSDVLGCILLGSNLVDLNGDGEIDVASSRQTIAAFENFMQKKPFSLTIT